MLIPIHFPELEIAESNHAHCDRDQTHADKSNQIII